MVYVALSPSFGAIAQSNTIIIILIYSKKKKKNRRVQITDTYARKPFLFSSSFY